MKVFVPSLFFVLASKCGPQGVIKLIPNTGIDVARHQYTSFLNLFLDRDMGTEFKFTTTLLMLTAAVLANGVAGLLYVWSLFILPIEAALSLNRADLGLISSVALISFTFGVLVLPIIMRWIGRLSVVILAFALMAGGHLAFGISASWVTLTLGYGLGFGAGSGLAYGFALSLAASLPARIRAPSIGLALGAFALSGIVLPVVLGNWISMTAPSTAFLGIGIATLVVGALCATALAGVAGIARESDKTAPSPSGPISIDPPFLILSLILFLICFTGLAVVSQSAAIAASTGIAAAVDPGWWGKDYAWFVERHGNMTGLFLNGEDLPKRENRITLNMDRLDSNDVPIPVVTYAEHPNDLAMQVHGYAAMRNIHKAAGAVSRNFAATTMLIAHLDGA